ERVDLKIEDGNVAGFVVRGLRGAVYDHVKTVFLEQVVQRSAVPNIDTRVLNSLGGALQWFEVPGSVTLRAEKYLAHVVVHADDTMALAVKMFRRFGSDQTAAACDEYGFHVCVRGSIY